MILRKVVEMDNIGRKRSYSKKEQDTLDFVENIVSTSECTGLEPTPPKSEAEAASYANLANVPDSETMQPQKGFQDKCSRG